MVQKVPRLGNSGTGETPTDEEVSKAIRTVPTHRAQPSLRSIHPDSSLSKAGLDFWGRKSTPEIIDSLRPGQTEALRVYPDGRVANGNTRIKILRDRGVEIDSLPREIHTP